MEIKRIRVYNLVMKLKSSFETSFGKTINRNCVIFGVEDSSGLIGWGESPVDEGPWYSYETVETTLYVAKDFLIPTLLKTKKINDPKDFVEMTKGVRGYRMAKAGIEMALWDLKAKLEGKPLYKILGGIRNYIESGISIGIIGDEEALLKAVGSFLEEGYKRVKIKIKQGWDLKPIKLIREEFGEIPLQVDANAAYSLEDLHLFKQMDDYNLLMIEQPLSYEDLHDHAELQSKIRTPICLDESIKSIYDAKVALKLGSCKIINIKPSRVGGLNETKLIHDYAMTKGIPVWIGGMLETGIGRSHLIASATLPNVKYPNDIGQSSRYWEEDIIEPPWVLRKDGTIPLNEKPGIGVEVIEERLMKYTKKQLEFTA